MRTLSSNTNTAIAAPVTQPAYLVEMLFPGSPLRMNTTANTVNYASNIFIPYDVKVQGLTWENAGAQKGKLIIGNTDLTAGALVLAQGVADVTINIWAFWAAATSSGDPVQVFSGAGDDADIMPNAVMISLVPSNQKGLFSPRRRITPEQGFNHLPAPHTQYNWNGQIFILEPSDY